MTNHKHTLASKPKTAKPTKEETKHLLKNQKGLEKPRNPTKKKIQLTAQVLHSQPSPPTHRGSPKTPHNSCCQQQYQLAAEANSHCCTHRRLLT